MRNNIFILIFLIIAMSCGKQEVCEENLQAEAIAKFHTLKQGEIKDTTISGVFLYGIRENLNDSLLYDSAKVSKIYIPLDPGSDMSAFVLRIQDVSDTINIYHTSTVYLISFTCGFANNFVLTGINSTNQKIKMTEIINENVYSEESEIEEHISIHF